jgi:hypothetical protein
MAKTKVRLRQTDQMPTEGAKQVVTKMQPLPFANPLVPKFPSFPIFRHPKEQENNPAFLMSNFFLFGRNKLRSLTRHTCYCFCGSRKFRQAASVSTQILSKHHNFIP